MTFARPRTTTFHARRSGESTFDRAAVGGKYCRHQGASRCRGVFLRTPSVPASRRLTHARRASSRLCVTRSSRRVSVNRLPSRRLVSSNVIAQHIHHSGYNVRAVPDHRVRASRATRGLPPRCVYARGRCRRSVPRRTQSRRPTHRVSRLLSRRGSRGRTPHVCNPTDAHRRWWWLFVRHEHPRMCHAVSEGRTRRHARP